MTTTTPPLLVIPEPEVSGRKLKAQMRAHDALAAERRRMPWMEVEQAYTFEGPTGTVSLLDLFNISEQQLNTEGLQVTTTIDPNDYHIIHESPMMGDTIMKIQKSGDPHDKVDFVGDKSAIVSTEYPTVRNNYHQLMLGGKQSDSKPGWVCRQQHRPSPAGGDRRPFLV